MSRKAVVFGAAGQLGMELMRVLQARQYQAAGFGRAQVDITDPAAVERVLARSEADVVFNAAAYNQVDVAESEPRTALEVNGLAVRNLALACRQTDSQFVHFSTDYVFDGRAGRPYTEDDPTHPLGAYAVSKFVGEVYAQAYLARLLIVRTSGVFGPGALGRARGNFVELMLRLAASGQTIRVVEDHIASPTFAPWLAARTVDLVDRQLTGIVHVGGGTPISWFDYARMIFEMARMHPSLQATNEREFRTAARRPKYSALSNAKMESLGLEPFPPLRQGLEAYFAARGSAVSGGRV